MTKFKEANCQIFTKSSDFRPISVRGTECKKNKNWFFFQQIYLERWFGCFITNFHPFIKFPVTGLHLIQGPRAARPWSPPSSIGARWAVEESDDDDYIFSNCWVKIIMSQFQEESSPRNSKQGQCHSKVKLDYIFSKCWIKMIHLWESAQEGLLTCNSGQDQCHSKVKLDCVFSKCSIKMINFP